MTGEISIHYNRTAGPTLKPLEQGQPINIYDHHSRTWERGAVLTPAKEPRSYILKNDKTGSIYRRTRVQLRSSSVYNRGTNNPSLIKTSSPVTNVWPNYTPKQKLNHKL